MARLGEGSSLGLKAVPVLSTMQGTSLFFAKTLFEARSPSFGKTPLAP
jgi:hypothetical protein